MNKEQIEMELILRVKARENLLYYTKYTMSKFQINWHHELMCKYLDMFENKLIKKLMILCPPQVGKTELSTRRFLSYHLGRNPDARCALVAYNQTLASKFNRDIQKIMGSAEYAQIFPNTRLSSRSMNAQIGDTFAKNSELFEILDAEGFLKTVGIGGPLTSTTVDLGTIDDPIKDAKEAYSQIYRDRLWEWYETVFLSRLHNESQQLATFTRWHEDDLAGRILEREADEWVVLKLPAIKYEENDEDPRELGEALWPEKHSLETYRKTEANSPKVFMSLYQQEPIDKQGEIFAHDQFIIVDLSDIPMDKYAKSRTDFVADTAYKDEEENDPSAFLSYKVIDNDLIITDYFNKRMRFSLLIEKLTHFVRKNGVRSSKVKVEPKASGTSVVDHLKVISNLNISEYKEKKGGKVANANAVEPYVSSGRVKLVKGAWNAAFIQECVAFPRKKHDEAVDLLVMAINEGLVRKKIIKRRVKIIH